MLENTGEYPLRDIPLYRHTDKQRLNNPPAGLAGAGSGPDSRYRTYACDPNAGPSPVTIELDSRFRIKQ